MDAVEDIATPEAMQGYVEQYLNEHPIELDETLTDSKKAAPANLAGQLKQGELLYYHLENYHLVIILNLLPIL